jgi:hypothetical protein
MPPKVVHTAYKIRDDEWTECGILLVRFYKDMCYDKDQSNYPRGYTLEDVVDLEINEDDPRFDGLFAPIFMGLVEHLINHGDTGVSYVGVVSPRKVAVIADVEKVESVMKLRAYLLELKDLIAQIIDYVDACGFPSVDPFEPV